MVYFLKVLAERQPIKIGHTKNLERRMQELQSANPFELEFIGVMDGDFEKEQEVHKEFSRLRVSGRKEWYKNDGSIVEYVKKNGQTL